MISHLDAQMAAVLVGSDVKYLLFSGEYVDEDLYTLSEMNLVCYILDIYTKPDINILIHNSDLLLSVVKKPGFKGMDRIIDTFVNRHVEISKLFLCGLEFHVALELAIDYVEKRIGISRPQIPDYMVSTSSVAWKFKCLDGTVYVHKQHPLILSSALMADIIDTLDTRDPTIECPHYIFHLKFNLNPSVAVGSLSPVDISVLRWLNPSDDYLFQMIRNSIPNFHRPKNVMRAIENLSSAYASKKCYHLNGDLVLDWEHTSNEFKQVDILRDTNKIQAIYMDGEYYYPLSVLD